MKSGMGRMLLLTMAFLIGSGYAHAFGTKGDGMDRGAGTMKDDQSMQKHEGTMKQDGTKHDGTMMMQKQDTMTHDRSMQGTMQKDDGMQGSGSDKAGAMKDGMKQDSMK